MAICILTVLTDLPKSAKFDISCNSRKLRAREIPEREPDEPCPAAPRTPGDTDAGRRDATDTATAKEDDAGGTSRHVIIGQFRFDAGHRQNVSVKNYA